MRIRIMSYELQGKVVLVTGAANGIGAGVARLALQEGAKHVAILDVDQTGFDFENTLKTEFGSGRAQFYPCDVTSDEQLFTAFGSVAKSQGGFDVVINNAGIMNDSIKMYKKEIAINLTAVVTSTLKAMELMRKDRGGAGGTVINISSTAGLSQSFFVPIYRATKTAVVQFSNCIGNKETFLETDVRVITVCLGGTVTSLSAPNKIESHDGISGTEKYNELVKNSYLQKLESAARGVIEAYKQGQSGSTWIAERDLPARDATDSVARAFQVMGEHN